MRPVINRPGPDRRISYLAMSIAMWIILILVVVSTCAFHSQVGSNDSSVVLLANHHSKGASQPIDKAISEISNNVSQPVNKIPGVHDSGTFRHVAASLKAIDKNSVGAAYPAPPPWIE